MQSVWVMILITDPSPASLSPLGLSQNECLYSDDIPPEVSYRHIRLVAKELPAQDFIDEVCAAARAFWDEVSVIKRNG